MENINKCQDDKFDKISKLLKNYNYLCNKKQINKNIFKKYKNNKKIYSKIQNKNLKYYEIILNERLNHKFYKQINLRSVKNSIYYIFEKFKSGIYISIRNNNLNYFYLNNSQYINEYKHLDINRKDIIKNLVYKNKNKWKFTGCLVNVLSYNSSMEFYKKNKWKLPEEQLKDNKTYYKVVFYLSNIIDWLNLLLKERKISDVDFIINIHDQLCLTNNYDEPLNHLFYKNKKISKKYRFKKYLPILSLGFYKKNYLDLPFITPDDIMRITKKYYPPGCSNNYINTNYIKNWNNKIPTAMFRGSSTSCGTNTFNNPRLKVAYLNNKWKNNERYNNNNKIDGIQYLNAGITTMFQRYKKHKSDKYIKKMPMEILTKDNILIKEIELLDLKEQSKYKYLLYIEGNVLAYRIASMFRMHSVILYVESEYKPWFYNFLKNYENIIFVKKDLSNLGKIITWCKKNDNECKKIAENAYKLYQKIFTKKGLLDYTEFLLNNIANNFEN